jgi:putative Holliday junction resolvase
VKILAIDYGQKRMGIAISDSLGITAQPHPWIPNDKQLEDRLLKMIQEHQISEIVIGLPLTLKGTASQMTLEVEAFAENLRGKVSIPVELQDERFSTMESEKILIAANVSREKRKDVRDSMVASMILQDYLERKKL